MLTPSPSHPHRPDLAFLLSPTEKARKPYPWKKYDVCPKCGSRNYWEQTDELGSCKRCGTWVFREILVGHDRVLSPYRPRKQNRTVVCCVPGCGAEFKTTSLHKEVRCPRCRDRIRKQNNARYRKEARLNLKSPVRSDDAAVERGVKTVVAVNETRKEATTE